MMSLSSTLRRGAAAAAAAAALLLAGCSGGPAEIPDSWLTLIEGEAKAPPPVPAECATDRDPKWSDLPPDRDVLQDEAARNARVNKDRFREIAGLRRVCQAGLVAEGKGKGTSK